MKRVITASLAIATMASFASASDLNVSVKASLNDTNAIEVAVGATVDFYITGDLTDDLNEGLALVGYNLHFTGGPLPSDTVDIPAGVADCSNPMSGFVKPEGITNPAGFTGTLIGDDLVQVGGAQNTIKNTVANAAFPIGTVLTGIAQPAGCGTAILATGSVTAPVVPGLYTLELSELFANVITDGEIGDVFWATEAAGVGSIGNLAITVIDICPPDNGLVASTPADQQSLWRTAKNIIRIDFGGSVAAVVAGDYEIRELLDAGAYGPDLAASFDMGLEGSTLRIQDLAGTLAHRTWYAVINANPCDGIGDFELQFVVQVGDADGNRFVTPVDVGQINASPLGAVADDSRFDIDGNGFRTAADVGLANAGQGGLPAKPAGH